MANIHQNDLMSSLSRIFGSSKYSDLTIRCGSDVYKVHRAVICPRSDLFAAACDSGFKESMTATIILDDDDQSTVRRMLTYLYTLDYDDGNASPAVAVAASQNTDGVVTDQISKAQVEDDDEIVAHWKRMNNIRVYALAEKYNISALKDLAKTKFKPRGNTVMRLYRFEEVAAAVFTSTPETDSGLRDIIISRATTAANLKVILKEGLLAPVIGNHGSFGLAMLLAVIRKYLILEQEKQNKGAKTEQSS